MNVSELGEMVCRHYTVIRMSSNMTIFTRYGSHKRLFRRIFQRSECKEINTKKTVRLVSDLVQSWARRKKRRKRRIEERCYFVDLLNYSKLSEKSAFCFIIRNTVKQAPLLYMWTVNNLARSCLGIFRSWIMLSDAAKPQLNLVLQIRWRYSLGEASMTHGGGGRGCTGGRT